MVILFETKNKTIIFSTHRMEQVEQICDSITLIADGRNVLTGSVDDIKQQFKKNILSGLLF